MQAPVATNRAKGHVIHARTGCAEWYGEKLDLAWAIGVLHPAANPSAPPVRGFNGKMAGQLEGNVASSP